MNGEKVDTGMWLLKIEGFEELGWDAAYWAIGTLISSRTKL